MRQCDRETRFGQCMCSPVTRQGFVQGSECKRRDWLSLWPLWGACGDSAVTLPLCVVCWTGQALPCETWLAAVRVAPPCPSGILRLWIPWAMATTDLCLRCVSVMRGVGMV